MIIGYIVELIKTSLDHHMNAEVKKNSQSKNDEQIFFF